MYTNLKSTKLELKRFVTNKLNSNACSSNCQGPQLFKLLQSYTQLSTLLLGSGTHLKSWQIDMWTHWSHNLQIIKHERINYSTRLVSVSVKSTTSQLPSPVLAENWVQAFRIQTAWRRNQTNQSESEKDTNPITLKLQLWQELCFQVSLPHRSSYSNPCLGTILLTFARVKTCYMHYHTPFLGWEIKKAIKQFRGSARCPCHSSFSQYLFHCNTAWNKSDFGGMLNKGNRIFSGDFDVQGGGNLAFRFLKHDHNSTLCALAPSIKCFVPATKITTLCSNSGESTASYLVWSVRFGMLTRKAFLCGAIQGLQDAHPAGQTSMLRETCSF